MFKKKFPSLSSLGSDGNTSFLRAARAGHLDKVLEQLKNNVDINTSNANGLNALHLASKDGHVHVVTELLKRGANVDSATKKGNTALHIASLAGQEEVVRLLVDNGAAVNVQSQNGFTPLYMAAQESHDSVVKYLLSNGANQSLATEDGFTPLAVAMQQGHDKVVAVLLESDTRGKVRLPALHIAAKKDDCKAAALLLQNEHNPDVTSKSGFTPLHIASHYGNEAIANLLLTKGADVNYSAKHNITPLHVAAKWGKSNMVSLLLERGAHIESKTRDGLTPLHCAARSGHEQVVDMMLERGAPISCKTKNGLAPLHMSSQGDHVDAARILLYHRAPVDEVTVDYLTALHVAAHCGHCRVAKLLLDRKADPNARALNGFTPLHIACKKNRIKVVELLLKHGASIEATTESGLTPLHVASFMGCMNIVIYLLQHEASADVPTVRGETPLHLAARANQTDIIRILLRNGAQVDARAREHQTPLHIAARLGNVDIVMLLLQHGASVDSTTKDLYTALHIAAKEGQDEVATVLLDNGASLTATTKKGFTPLHLAAKYGNMKVAKLLLQRDAPVDAQGKNGVTPLHVASHYDHQNVALLLLDKGASPHATAKNGHTPLHIAARKNQMDIATTLLEYGAKANAESKAGFTPLHLSAQEGHTDMSTLLIEHHADPNHKAKNGLAPLHLCAQEDRVNVASVLVKNNAEVDATTKAGYTPLHVASHFGQLNMVRFLLQNNADVTTTTAVGYTPLHQAAQQGHATIISTLLDSGAPPNATTNQGQTALAIAQKLGYISVVEALKSVTEQTITPMSDEKYKVVAPETMQETFMSDSEDEGGEDTMLSEQPYRYLTVDEMKSLGDDSLPIDVTRDERIDSNRECMMAVDDTISPQHLKENYSHFMTDNVDIAKHPLNVGFLVSFLVDARGGAMRGCRHSGVRVIVPPRVAAMPTRVTCRYLKRDKLPHPPPLMEGEALASRILELGPVGAKFLGPVMIEVPHFGSLRSKEREIVILRSDNGETWREHTFEATDEAVQDILSHSFEKEADVGHLEEGGRTTRILTSEFPHYLAVVSRVRQEVHAIGPEGGMVSSSVVPQVQAVFPQGALTKKIKVGLQAQPISAELAAKLLGNRVAVSPIVTVEPRRRKFHKPITLTIPVPQAANKGMINQYSGDAPTLRLLCSITGGTTRAQWEDVTGSTPLTFVNDCVSFTTTVSARFWLMDCRNITEATKMATELYREAIHVPFMAKFVVFAKRVDVLEARLRVFCMTDDKEDKTLEHQEHFTEVAKSRDVEVLEGKLQYVEFAGNLIPVTKSGEQLHLGFRAFRENRLPFTVRVKDPHADTIGRTLFMREAKVVKGEPPQQPICVLNIVLPEDIIPEVGLSDHEIHKYSFIKDSSGLESYQRADLRLSDISNLLGEAWVSVASELGLSTSDVNKIKSDCQTSSPQQALVMLRLWLQRAGNKASASTLESALVRVGREDIVHQCMFNLDHSGFDSLREELGPSRDSSLRRNINVDSIYDQDIMKESESVEELTVVTRRKLRDVSKDDGDERKYEAEEKEVEEEKKSVSERRREIEKRLSQEKEKNFVDKKRFSQEPRVVDEKIVNLEKNIIEDSIEKEISVEKSVSPEEPALLSFAEKRLSFEQASKHKQKSEDRSVQDKLHNEEKELSREAEEKESSISFTQKRLSFEQGLAMKVPADETKKAVSLTDEQKLSYGDETRPLTPDEKKFLDQRRDSELFEGVTQGLGRLDAATFAPQIQDLLSPKVSKTPPPSPAEFKDTTGTVAWQDAREVSDKGQPSQDWANQPAKIAKPPLDDSDSGPSTIAQHGPEMVILKRYDDGEKITKCNEVLETEVVAPASDHTKYREPITKTEIEIHDVQVPSSRGITTTTKTVTKMIHVGDTVKPECVQITELTLGSDFKPSSEAISIVTKADNPIGSNGDYIAKVALQKITTTESKGKVYPDDNSKETLPKEISKTEIIVKAMKTDNLMPGIKTVVETVKHDSEENREEKNNFNLLKNESYEKVLCDIHDDQNAEECVNVVCDKEYTKMNTTSMSFKLNKEKQADDKTEASSGSGREISQENEMLFDVDNPPFKLAPEKCVIPITVDHRAVKTMEEVNVPPLRDDKLTDILIDMLIEQESTKQSRSDVSELGLSDVDIEEAGNENGLNSLIDYDKLKTNQSCSNSFATTKEKEVPEPIKNDFITEINYTDKDPPFFKSTYENSQTQTPLLKNIKGTLGEGDKIGCYIPEPDNSQIKNPLTHKEQSDEDAVGVVTTPTLHRKNIGGSQRLSREERPSLREITRIVQDSSSDDESGVGDESYIVTEPMEKIPLNQRKVSFKFESHGDKVKREESLESSDVDEEEEEEEGIEVEELDEEETGSDEDIPKGSETVIGTGPKSESTDVTGFSNFDTKHSSEGNIDDPNLRRVERRFERMASETLEKDRIAPAATEGEFQHLVSQLSTEEVNEALQLWDEGGLTPSDELDSKDSRDTPEGELQAVEALPEVGLVSSSKTRVLIGYAIEPLVDNNRDDPSSINGKSGRASSASLQPTLIEPSNMDDIPLKLVLPSQNNFTCIVSESLSVESTPSSESIPSSPLKINTLGRSYQPPSVIASITRESCSLVDSPLGSLPQPTLVAQVTTKGDPLGDDLSRGKGTSYEGATRAGTGGRAQVRPPLKYDISMDEEPEFDPREHDWRFQLPTHSEGEEGLFDLATGLFADTPASSGDAPTGSSSQSKLQ